MAKLHHVNAGLLIVRSAKQTMIPLTKDVTTIGRKFADIILDDPKISSSHTEIYRSGDAFHVKDLNSTNGTFVNRKPIKDCQLADQDIIEVGNSSLCFFRDIRDYNGPDIEPTLRQDTVSTKTREVVTSTKTMHQNALRVEILDGPNEGKNYTFRKPFITVGRKEADLVIVDVDVSRTHAMIEVFSKSSVFIKDLGSTNGTYVNNRRIQAEKLSEGDEVQVGNTKFSVKLMDAE